MSTPPEEPVLAAARAEGRAGADAMIAEWDRRRNEKIKAGQALLREQQAALRRLAERYGSDQEKAWIADPNGPLVDPLDMIRAFLHKAWPDHQSPEMQRAPELEPEDAVAAVHMIGLGRFEAERREIATMRRALQHGATWTDLAHALETTVDELQQWLTEHGERLDSWPPNPQPPQ
jgi:DNA-binding transcriptional regulator YiaG